jgi:hypothetical protein
MARALVRGDAALAAALNASVRNDAAPREDGGPVPR